MQTRAIRWLTCQASRAPLTTPVSCMAACPFEVQDGASLPAGIEPRGAISSSPDRRTTPQRYRGRSRLARMQLQGCVSASPAAPISTASAALARRGASIHLCFFQTGKKASKSTDGAPKSSHQRPAGAVVWRHPHAPQLDPTVRSVANAG
ncbi:hypothetical protein BU26DRAFT_1744 [Trematosphaeria pertusa]|uniref:Uncharacterized protein n=1 Tax=Trematosphaeria pertusa TaxID=390896 RepID=A0A6A6J062_9PLEO|nr:uncharacterized protein BU26DRAFT_1744 [Trematosphaeria pertusa]KAF2255542.1 hypothetical protein BU26DRAFT_1744 [Trematosphaeria pertusa]